MQIKDAKKKKTMHMQSAHRYQFIVQQSALGYILAALFASNFSILEGKRARRNTSQLVTNSEGCYS